MHIQRSYLDETPALYLVPTPIGNLKDITYRSVEILQTVARIYAEDTRHSSGLLRHYGIDTPLRSLHEHNESARIEEIDNMLAEGVEVALITDAGTPLISDPGGRLVDTLVARGRKVVALPGPTAFLPAIVASGLPPHPFLFFGFLPSKAGERRQRLRALSTLTYTLVFYEAPHRLHASLEAMKESFGERRVVIARELSKKYEEITRLRLSEVHDLPKLKGELVLLVEGASQDVSLELVDAVDHVQLLLEDGFSEKDAIKQAASARGVKKNEVYMAYQRYKTNLE